MSVELIVTCDANRGIGLNNSLPWFCPEELAIFREKTQNSVLLVGRKTAQNLPKLPNRIVVSLTARTFLDCNHAVKYTQKTFPGRQIFVAGGAETYKRFLRCPNLLDTLHISIMKKTYPCDAVLDIDFSCWVIREQKEYKDFVHYVMKYSPGGEQQYLALLKSVLSSGTMREGRNGETKSVFFSNLSFDLRKGFPLLTTKKMFTRGIVEELLFFLRGETDTKLLEAKGVNIWKGNTNREFLDSIGMKNRQEGLMGPMYGYQWRHFNARYEQGKPVEKGVDQLENLIQDIRRDPTSRRLMMSAYNPCQTAEGVLAPCHSIILQFYVSEGCLDMVCYNRSQDLFLGTPFNIASSALLLVLIATVTKLQPRHLHMSLGDVHIYKDHYSVAQEQAERFRYPLPVLQVKKELNSVKDLEMLESTDFAFEGYVSHPAIKASMVA